MHHSTIPASLPDLTPFRWRPCTRTAIAWSATACCGCGRTSSRRAIRRRTRLLSSGKGSTVASITHLIRFFYTKVENLSRVDLKQPKRLNLSTELTMMPDGPEFSARLAKWQEVWSKIPPRLRLKEGKGLGKNLLDHYEQTLRRQPVSAHLQRPQKTPAKNSRSRAKK